MRDRVVVGVDGSEGSVLALRWASGYAERFDAALVAVIAVLPEHGGPSGYLAPPVSSSSAALVGREVLDVAVEAVLGPEPTGLSVQCRVEEGHAHDVLIRMADGAALLVVGASGRRGLRGTALGSVALRCASDAPCPVVVVRPVPAATSAAEPPA